MTSQLETAEDFEGELFRLRNFRVCTSAFQDAWLVQLRKRNGRWISIAECQTQVQVLRAWINLTGDDGAEVCRLPERFRRAAA